MRTYVLREGAAQRVATDAEIEQMREVINEAMEAGACGFSTTRSQQHNGADGIPMPSRLANQAELMELSGTLKRSGKGVLMMTKAFETPVSDIEKLSIAAERPYLIAALLHSRGHPLRTFDDLSAIGDARARGIPLYGAVSPCPLNMDFSLRSPYLLEGFACWNPLMGLPENDYKAALADKNFRIEFINELNDGKIRVFGGEWDKVYVAQVENKKNSAYEGKSVANLADEHEKAPFDFMLDLALEENLMTMFTATVMNDDEDAVGKMMCDDNAIISLSDAGAHLTFLCDAGYGLHFLGHWSRDKNLMSIERAAHKLTLESAQLFGIKDRGVIKKGAWADLLLFDPKEVGRGCSERVYDLPAGASRLTTPALGVHGVWINGVKAVDENGAIKHAPLTGQVLRDFAS